MSGLVTAAICYLSLSPALLSRAAQGIIWMECARMPRPTEEQILRILNTVARKYSKRSKGKFEVDELVNEVWLYGYVQKLKDIQLVWLRARLDMIKYMRRYSTKTSTLYENRLRNFDYRQRRCFPTMPDLTIDTTELFILPGLSKKQRMIVLLLAEGFNQNEISKIMGYTQPWVSLVILRIIKPYLVERKFFA